jgi:hypothetical protein
MWPTPGRIFFVVRGVLLPRAPGGDRVREPRVYLPLAEEPLELATPVVREPSEGAAEHEPCNSVRVGRGVDHRHEAAGRVAEEVDPLEVQVRARHENAVS